MAETYVNCEFCGRKRARLTWTRDGKTICRCCVEKYYRKLKICVSCGKLAKSRVSEKNGGPLCGTCYLRTYKAPVETCSVCGMNNPVYKRGVGGVSICCKCYQPPKEECSLCGEKKIVNTRVGGAPICISCINTDRYKNDWVYNIKIRLRGNLGNALRGRKVKSCSKYGVNFNKIAEYIGPCPGDGYHVDHIIPLSAFDFSKDHHVRAAFAPENHRWLRDIDNLSKHAKYDKEEFNNYVRLFMENDNGAGV